MTFTELTTLIARCLDEQLTTVAGWHAAGAEPTLPPLAEAGPERLRGLVLAEHLSNYRLWHVEDEARRVDVGPEVIAGCKRAIDRLNQERNDGIERVDECLVNLLSAMLPAGGAEKYNTETVGSALDRTSIMALKIFHMAEEAARESASPGHCERCAAKLHVLKAQRADLGRSILELIEDYASGLKRPKVSYQFKMYNDPSLNPALYGRGAGEKKP
jgi:hypothetical protein